MTATASRTTVPKTSLPAELVPPEQLAQCYDRLLGLLADRVVNDAIGTSIPARTRLADAPQTRLWLGMLSSEPQLVADQLSGRGYRSKLVPPAQGFSFRVATLPVSLEVTVSAAYYVALHPSVDEQRYAVTADAATNSHAAQAVGQSPGPATLQNVGSGTQQGRKLAQVWNKCVIDPVTLTIEVETSGIGSRRIGADELTTALADAARAPVGSELFRCRRPSGPPGSLPRDDDMLDANTWIRYAIENLLDSSHVRPPAFSAALQVDVAVAGGP